MRKITSDPRGGGQEGVLCGRSATVFSDEYPETGEFSSPCVTCAPNSRLMSGTYPSHPGNTEVQRGPHSFSLPLTTSLLATVPWSLEPVAMEAYGLSLTEQDHGLPGLEPGKGSSGWLSTGKRPSGGACSEWGGSD